MSNAAIADTIKYGLWENMQLNLVFVVSYMTVY